MHEKLTVSCRLSVLSGHSFSGNDNDDDVDGRTPHHAQNTRILAVSGRNRPRKSPQVSRARKTGQEGGFRSQKHLQIGQKDEEKGAIAAVSERAAAAVPHHHKGGEAEEEEGSARSSCFDRTFPRLS